MATLAFTALGASAGAAAAQTITQVKLAAPDEINCQGATPKEETLIRRQIQMMQPSVLPARIIFVPHWKYVDTTRIFQLHVPKGYSSAMFTHLPSRTVFIDYDRYLGERWLGHYIAHELGHLATSSPSESDAERVAHELRRHLKDAGKRGAF